MELGRLMPPIRIASGLLAFSLTTLSAYPQASTEPPRKAEASSSGTNLDALRQIQELRSELGEMRAEVKEARDQMAELRRELQSTGDQMLALRSELAATRGQTQAQTASALPAAPRQAEGQAIESRLSKVEEDQQLLSAKVDDQYQTKVGSGSKYRVRLSGMALLNAFSTRGATDNFDLPDYAVPRDGSESNSGFGATLRQSVLGLEVFGPSVAGARTKADLQADFFGGFAATPDGVTAGLVRLRTAGLRMDWENTSLVMGQYAPFFSPLSPTSLASVAYPALAYSGNLWVWTPQISLEHRFRLPDGSNLSVQGGIMDPLTGEAPVNSPYRAAQAGEMGGQPAYAARVGWAQGALSLGVGGYYARQNWGFGRIVDAWAGTADWNIPLSRWFSLTGEFYRGRAIGGLGAAEGRSVALTGMLYDQGTAVAQLNSTGGWAQLKFIPVPKLEFNGAFGEDFSPTPSSLYASPGAGYQSPYPIARNQSAFVNGIYHLRSNLMLSVEYRRLRTAQTQPGLSTANQVSLSAATLF